MAHPARECTRNFPRSGAGSTAAVAAVAAGASAAGVAPSGRWGAAGAGVGLDRHEQPRPRQAGSPAIGSVSVIPGPWPSRIAHSLPKA